MNEEEKKAIKGLEWSQKQMRLGNLPDYDQGHYADIRVVLNLIEKQQNEIEQLANGIRVLGTNPDITTEEIIKEFTEKPITEEYMEEFENSYISKDKIRDMIKVLEEYFDGNKENTPTSTNQFIIDSVAIRVSISLLKELLEE